MVRRRIAKAHVRLCAVWSSALALACVVAVPNAVFYADPARGRHLVRFAFCKRMDVLEEAADRLARAGAS